MALPCLSDGMSAGGAATVDESTLVVEADDASASAAYGATAERVALASAVGRLGARFASRSSSSIKLQHATPDGWTSWSHACSAARAAARTSVSAAWMHARSNVASARGRTPACACRPEATARCSAVSS